MTALRSASQTAPSRLGDGMENPAGPRPNDRTYADDFGGDASEPITYTPIAIASSPFRERHGAPRQPGTEGRRGEAPGSFRLIPENLGGVDAARSMLDGLEGFSHVIVLGHLHLNTGWNPRVTPPRLRHLDDGTAGGRAASRKGLLATRAPHRPNPVGMSVLRLHSVDVDDMTLRVNGTDFLDGTPVLDIKPYLPRHDSFPAAKAGWLDDVDAAERRGELPEVTHDGGEAEAEARRHRKSYRISALGRGSASDVATDTGHALRTDVPRKMGGTDSAPQPVEHLLAALAGCCQATAVYVGRSMTPRLLIKRIEFDLEAHRDERGALQRPIEDEPDVPARLQSVSGTARVFLREERKKKGGGDDSSVGAETRDEEIKLLGERTEIRCPVANMMAASGCAMDVVWVNGRIADGVDGQTD